MKRWTATAWIATVFLFAATAVSEERPTIEVRGPTVIAFYVGSGNSEDEALDDFQWYAMQAAPKLKKVGIRFEQVYAPSFRVRIGTTTRTIHRFKVEVGYYLISPGRPPHIEYGVITDDDLLQLANKYFNIGTQH